MRIAPSKVRFYADRGLLPHEREAGKRRFYPDVLCRVAMIEVSQKVGLSLEQIGESLESLPPGRAPSPDDWNRLSGELEGVLQERIAELFALLDQLSLDLNRT